MLKTRDLLNVDPENKGLTQTDPENKELSSKFPPEKRKAQLVAAPSVLIFIYIFSIAGWNNSHAIGSCWWGGSYVERLLTGFGGDLLGETGC
ncbi:MAG: hypothetical protein WAM66_00135 [Acidobacteriaceae bacterium]